MSLLRPLPASFAAKIILLNVFLRSLWSRVGRHVLIPQALRKRIEDNDLKYLSKVPYFASGAVSHLTKLYGLRVQLQDFELANIAGLIATAWQVEHSNSKPPELLRAHAADAGRRRLLWPS